MKILAITFSSGLTGGANRSFLMVISALQKIYNDEIHVILPDYGPLNMQLERINITYDIVKVGDVGVQLQGDTKDALRRAKATLQSFSHWFAAFKNYRKFKDQKFDIVYINGTNQLFGYYIAKLLDIPFVWHFRGYIKNGSYFGINHKKMLNDKMGKIIVISKQMQHDIPEYLGIHQDRIEMVHNGLQWKDSLRSSQNRDNGIHCVQCGRITAIKGHKDSINAIRILHERGYKNVYLHIAGLLVSEPGSYGEELENLVNKYGLDEHVIFEGQVSNMSEFRQNMNIELMCSVCEPFGRVTVEGMHSGLVVIGANTGGTLDIIQDGHNGLLYQQGNAEDLADKIQYVIDNEREADEIALNAIDFAEHNFTMEQNVAEIEKILSDRLIDCKKENS